MFRHVLQCSLFNSAKPVLFSHSRIQIHVVVAPANSIDFFDSAQLMSIATQVQEIMSCLIMTLTYRKGTGRLSPSTYSKVLGKGSGQSLDCCRSFYNSYCVVYSTK